MRRGEDVVGEEKAVLLPMDNGGESGVALVCGCGCGGENVNGEEGGGGRRACGVGLLAFMSGCGGEG